MDGKYTNRELSWLNFNERVLRQALDHDVPLFERLRFVSIFTSNLDEFYMVRVGSLFDQSLIGDIRDNKTGMTPREQIDAVNRAVRALYPKRDMAYNKIMGLLSEKWFWQADINALDGGEKRLAMDYFERRLKPLLSPQIIDPKHPFPHIENKTPCIAVRLRLKSTRCYGIIPLPRFAERIYRVPGSRSFLLTEDIIMKFAGLVFGTYKIEERAILRVTRNADIQVDEDIADDADFRSVMQEIVKKRARLAPVRLETSADGGVAEYFASQLGLGRDQCFTCSTPLDMGFVSKLAAGVETEDRREIFYAPVHPQWPFALKPGSSMIEQVKKGDVLLSYPYESMKPFTELLHEAAEDPAVVSIKITLYRIGQQSQIVQDLCAAAENGKDVTVVVELRARFDEQNNINWSKFMEESGCKVIYGLDGYKIHSKIMLVTRKNGGRLEYITHVGTGNYNELTARLYADINILTADQTVGEDAAAFFNNITIANPLGKYRRLLISPSTLKDGIIELISGQTMLAREGRPARVIAKMNSLTDKDLIDALYSASQAGVRISLIIRGICCLRPGIAGYSDNIEVRSIVGRFLEHSRVYCFGAGKRPEVLISSADLMTRNTERRVEIAVPVADPLLAARVVQMLGVMLKDNVKAMRQSANGSYESVTGGRQKIDSQMYFCAQARCCSELADYRQRKKEYLAKSRIQKLLGGIERMLHHGENDGQGT